MTLDNLLNLPKHVAIIMDGNGRWAQKNGLQRFEGHKNGIKPIEECLKECQKLKIKYLTLYAFSSDNWKRPKIEVNSLMNLLNYFLKKETNTLMENDIQLKVIGNIQDLPNSQKDRIMYSTNLTTNNKSGILTLAINYGSREEIINASKKLYKKIEENLLTEKDITEEIFSKLLHTNYMPDPDLLIRTGGEHRISNFLLWQLSYCEIYFTKILWPNFKKENFLDAIKDFQNRKRRFGSV